VLVAAVVATTTTRANAATPITEARVDRTKVGIGDVVGYDLVIRSDGELDATDVKPGKIDGFELVTRQIAPRQAIDVRNGVITRSNSITVTYRLRAKTLGAHVLGPGAFVIRGRNMPTPAVRIEVVPAASAPPPPPARRPRGFVDPFDDLFFQDEPEPPPPEPPVDPLARIEAAPRGARAFFVRLATTERQIVVGAQLTVHTIVYARQPPKVNVKRPPGFSEFRAIALGPQDDRWHPITIGGDPWHYAVIEASAAFPLRVGALEIAPTTIQTTAMDLFGGGLERDWDSDVLQIEAIEPPAEGRPIGYQLGDVVSGLEIAAEVPGRVVKDGHALVTLRMKGAGRLDPLRPILPTPAGLAWTTTSDETRTSIDGKTVRGQRKILLDAKLERTGAIDLGEVAVQVWDPERASYVTARAPLGRVEVETAAVAPPGEEASALATLPPPRGRVGARGEGATIADRAATWIFVFGAPALVGLAQLAIARGRDARRRRAVADDSPAAQARAALAEAKRATDPASALGRALDRALEDATGIRARGLTRSERRRALERSDLPTELRDAVERALDALEASRFAGDRAPTVAEIAPLVDRLLARGAR
jgi:hypothetical protein